MNEILLKMAKQLVQDGQEKIEPLPESFEYYDKTKEIIEFEDWFDKWKMRVLLLARKLLDELSISYESDKRYTEIDRTTIYPIVFAVGSLSTIYVHSPVKSIIHNIQNIIEELELDISIHNNIEINSYNSTNSTSNIVFVIMAINQDMDPVYQAIELACKEYGLNPKRVDKIRGDYQITDRIIELIEEARFIIADLTHERPNVYFELGYARGIGKKVITILRDGTTVHFDVKDWRYIKYHDSRILEKELMEEIRAILDQM